MVFTCEADAQAIRRIEYIHPQSATSVSNVAREYPSRGGAGVGDGGGMDEPGRKPAASPAASPALFLPPCGLLRFWGSLRSPCVVYD